MGVYKEDELVGLSLDRGIVCQQCTTDDEWNNATLEQIITQDDLEKGDHYFCDECGKKL